MKNFFKKKPKEEEIPEVPKSDMYQAFRFMVSKIDDIVEEIVNDEVDTKPCPEVSYSQAGQAIRITDKPNNCVVTMKYNVWDKDSKDFIDKIYYRPYNAPEGVGNGGLMSIGVNDSTISYGTDYVSSLHLPYDEREAAYIYAANLHIFRPECGVINLHEDQWLYAKPFPDKGIE